MRTVRIPARTIAVSLSVSTYLPAHLPLPPPLAAEVRKMMKTIQTVAGFAGIPPIWAVKVSMENDDSADETTPLLDDASWQGQSTGSVALQVSMDHGGGGQTQGGISFVQRMFSGLRAEEHADGQGADGMNSSGGHCDGPSDDSDDEEDVR